MVSKTKAQNIKMATKSNYIRGVISYVAQKDFRIKLCGQGAADKEIALIFRLWKRTVGHMISSLTLLPMNKHQMKLCNGFILTVSNCIQRNIQRKFSSTPSQDTLGYLVWMLFSLFCFIIACAKWQQTNNSVSVCLKTHRSHLVRFCHIFNWIK